MSSFSPEFIEWTKSGTSEELLGYDLIEDTVLDFLQENFGRTENSTLFDDINIHAMDNHGRYPAGSGDSWANTSESDYRKADLYRNDTLPFIQGIESAWKSSGKPSSGKISSSQPPAKPSSSQPPAKPTQQASERASQDNIGLSGDTLLKLNVIRGAYDDEVTYADLEKHFGSIDQYTTSQYQYGTKYWAFPKNFTEYIPGAKDAEWIPQIRVDGKYVNLFDTPEFLDFYKKTFPEQYKAYGTEYNPGSNKLDNRPINKNRIPRAYALAQMSIAADLFKQNSVTLDFNKLSEKINAYKLSPEQEEDYQRRSVELASEIGVPYKDPDGKYYFKAFDAKSGGLLNYNLNEGSLKKGKLKDGKFVIDQEEIY